MNDLSRGIVYLVNRADLLAPGKTTTALIAGSAQQGPTWVVGAADLALDDSGPVAWARRVVGHRHDPRPGQPPSVFIELDAPSPLRLVDDARVLVRTNPASNLPHATWHHALRVLDEAVRRGARVVNPPAALRTFATKTGLLQLPDDIRPSTVVCARADVALDRVRELGHAVVKPVGGSQGSGVFITRPGDPNQRTAIELLLQTGPVVVQSWIEGAEGGDTRLFLLDGEPLFLDGAPAAISRIPEGGELRSNVHLGARPSASDLTPALRRIADRAGPVLRAHGVRIAGLDCIAGNVVEVNACSPGGLTDLSVLAGIDAVSLFIERIRQLLDEASP